jgi:hypothetical protein
MNLFGHLKGQKWKKLLKYWEKNGFLLTDLGFALPFQNFMPYIEIMKFWSILLVLIRIRTIPRTKLQHSFKDKKDKLRYPHLFYFQKKSPKSF